MMSIASKLKTERVISDLLRAETPIQTGHSQFELDLRVNDIPVSINMVNTNRIGNGTTTCTGTCSCSCCNVPSDGCSYTSGCG
jgi:hypothetical protein